MGSDVLFPLSRYSAVLRERVGVRVPFETERLVTSDYALTLTLSGSTAEYGERGQESRSPQLSVAPLTSLWVGIKSPVDSTGYDRVGLTGSAGRSAPAGRLPIGRGG